MNRLLLTLLALLTGFAAQVSPAQAAVRAGGEAEVGSVQAARGAVRLARQVAVRVAAERIAHHVRLEPIAKLPRFAVDLPTVYIGIDRAQQ
ncbi:MAG: hypothetical protein ABIQ81_09490 [Novosphingobium sp.]